MQKQVSIIMPRYSESPELLKKALYSIENQAGYDLNKVELIIVDDCGPTELKIPKTPSYSYTIKIIRLEKNAGPGWARQVGIDAAEGEWIYMLDADDQLFPTAFCLFSMAEPEKFDWVSFPGMQLGEKDQQGAIGPHKGNLTWVFGHFIRREYIKKTKVKFHKQIRSNEEQVFLQGLMARIDPTRGRELDIPIYLWCQQSTDTITRINNCEYARTCVPEWILGRKLVLDDLSSIGKIQELKSNLVQAMIHVYYSVHQTLFDDYDDWKENVELLAGWMYRGYVDSCESIAADEIKQLVLQGAASCDRQVTESYDDWLERIKELPDPKYCLQPHETMDKNKQTGEEVTSYNRILIDELEG